MSRFTRFTERVWDMKLPEGVTVIWRGEESTNFLPVRILSNGDCQYYDYRKKEWIEDDHPAMLALSKILVKELEIKQYKLKRIEELFDV